MRLIRFGALAVACALVAQCGSSPTSPSSQYPSVAGNYAGSVTIGVPALGGSLTCPASTSVTQSGASVTVAPIALAGSCASIGSLPVGDGTITTTGSLGSLTLNDVVVASCNGSYNAVASGGFFGSSLQFSIVYTAISGGCLTDPGNITFSGTLGKQ